MSAAVFTVVKVTPEFIVIRDLSNHYPQAKSVTNDADGVVDRVLTDHGTERRILYYDSSGELDELCHNGRIFTGFKAWRKAEPETEFHENGDGL
jgi:hypothetical protein